MKSILTLRAATTWVFGLWLVLVVSAAHAGEDTIKVGILHSLSGTMAISESVL
jgi:urea transport system substrate-binding protein